MSGIRTVADLMDRCHVDEDTGCWHWRLGLTHDGQPKCCATLADGTTKQSTGGRVAWMLRHGLTKLSVKTVVFRTRGCSTLCCNPKHLRAGSKAIAGAHLAKSGRLRGDPLRVIINTRNRAKLKIKLDEHRAAAIRESDESNTALMARYDVSRTTILDIRNGKRWRAPPSINPFGALVRLAA